MKVSIEYISLTNPQLEALLHELELAMTSFERDDPEYQVISSFCQAYAAACGSYWFFGDRRF